MVIANIARTYSISITYKNELNSLFCMQIPIQVNTRQFQRGLSLLYFMNLRKLHYIVQFLNDNPVHAV